MRRPEARAGSVGGGWRRWRPVLAALLLLLPGCVTARYLEGNDIPADRVEAIQPGVSTKEEILEWFGAPETFTQPSLLVEFMSDAGFTAGDALRIPFSDIMVFRRTRGRLKALLLILFNRIELRVANDSLIVFFDENGRVLHYGYREGTRALD